MPNSPAPAASDRRGGRLSAIQIFGKKSKLVSFGASGMRLHPVPMRAANAPPLWQPNCSSKPLARQDRPGTEPGREDRLARTVMSVFGVAPRRIGGVETFARELSNQLARLGWNSVLCFSAPPPEPVRRFLESPSVSIEVVGDVAQPTLATLRRTRELLRQYRPEVLHLYFTGLLSPFAWLGRLYSVKQVYFTDQGSHPEGYVPARAALWKRLVARGINRPLTRVICISDYNLQCMLTRGYVPADRACRIYNSVDLTHPSGDAARFRQKYAIPDHRAIVLQVSWVIPEKGIPDLLEAARLVLTVNPDVHFVIAGDGAHRQQYAALAGQMGISSNLTWTGLVEDPVAEGVYAAADVVCQLSRWQEGFGWVIAEAMACHKPVVATRVGGIPEVVEDGRSGFLVAPRQPAQAAEKILMLLADAGLRRRMGASGRQSVELRFHLERNVAELVKLYGIPQ